MFTHLRNGYLADAGLTRIAKCFWGVVTFLIPFQLQYDYILNAFYHYGAPYYDSGFFAQLLWHNDWMLTDPDLRDNYPYFCQHFSPLLLLVNLSSYFVPTHMVEFYAGFMGCVYAFLGLMMFWALSQYAKPRNHWQMATLAILGIAFAFNGVLTEGMWMTHFEYFIPLCIFLFLWHHKHGHRRLTCLFFILTLSLREDAGLHLTTFLGVLVAIRYWETRSLETVKPEMRFITFALIYSITAFAAVHFLRVSYNDHENLLYNTYLGTPPFAHLSFSLLWERLQHIAVEHVYMWLSLLISAAWSWRTRNPYLIAGFVAFIPWFIINWAANGPDTGFLFNYYAFPFIVCLSWPLLAPLWRCSLPLSQPVIRETLLLQTLLILAGVVAWNQWEHYPTISPLWGARWGGYALEEEAINRAITHQFVSEFDTGSGDLGHLIIDPGVASLISRKLGREHVELMNQNNRHHPADTLLYFFNSGTSSGEVLARQNEHHWQHNYCVTGTPICLLTNRSLQQLGVLASTVLEKRMQY